MKDRLILFVGPSGSGKTTIAKELVKEGYNVIQRYTTREPREPDEWGHIFIGKLVEKEGVIVGYDREGTQIFKACKGEKGEMIAYKKIYGEIYFATKDQYQGKGISIYVVDPKGAEQVRENVKDADVVTIFLMADEATREARILERENKTKYKNEPIKGYMALGNTRQRVKQDKEIFSVVKCDYVIDANREIEDVLDDIKQVIERSYL